MVTHIQDNWREALRKDFMKELFSASMTCDNDVLVRNVDEDAVNKMRLKIYGQQRGLASRFANRYEYAEMMEKDRDKTVSAGKMAGHADPREIPLEENIAEVYFQHYGHGFDGGPVVDRHNAPWICPNCGLKVATQQKSMPLNCPVCKHISPMGELVRDGVFKR